MADPANDPSAQAKEQQGKAAAQKAQAPNQPQGQTTQQQPGQQQPAQQGQPAQQPQGTAADTLTQIKKDVEKAYSVSSNTQVNRLLEKVRQDLDNLQV